MLGRRFLEFGFDELWEGGSFEVWGGEQERDLTFVEDVVGAFLAAGTAKEAWGQVYNIGGCMPITLKELARVLIEVAGEGSFVVREFPPERRKIDIGNYFADDRRFRELTGWRPSVELRDGLARSIAYYRANLSAYL